MNQNLLYLLLGLGVLIVLVWFGFRKREHLSLSQFPVPTCSTCKSCAFYSCGKCGTVYQLQNKVGQACDCGGTISYKVPVVGSCYRDFLKGPPQVGPVVPCGTENLSVRPPNVAAERHSSICGCDGQINDNICLERQGTFDTGSTMLRNVPCPINFPPVLPGNKVTMHKQNRHTSELDVYKHLEKGGLIIGSNKGKVIDYTMSILIKETEAFGAGGTPNFYYINGPVLVMTKVNDTYYWMYDYPIKYTPANYPNYVNSSTNWNIAKTAFKNGRKLLNPDAPIIFFSVNPSAKSKLQATMYACQQQGRSQSTTDNYYGTGKQGCDNAACLWGPEYGSGNWLLHV